MRNEVTARDRVHIKACQDTQCTVETDDPGLRCRNLDHLLDRVEQEALQRAYQKLLDMHMGALLQHGPGVAAGLALGIGVIHKMIPDQAANEALIEWAERVPGEQPHDECLSPDAAGKCPHGTTGTPE